MEIIGYKLVQLVLLAMGDALPMAKMAQVLDYGLPLDMIQIL